MRTLIILCFLLYSTVSLAIHKDKIYTNQYGNVKTFTITGFDNYIQTKNVEIFGKLAQKLCEKLAFKDTVYINFNHDYTNNNPNINIIENDENIQKRYVFSNPNFILKHQEKIRKKKNLKAIHIHILSTEFNIYNQLKILEAFIIKPFKTSLLEIKDYHNYDENINSTHKYYGLSEKNIDDIITSKDSETITELITGKTLFLETANGKGYFSKNTYCFETEKTNYETKSLLYLVALNKGILVFLSDTHYIYLSSKSKKDFDVSYSEIENKYPFQKSSTDYFDKFKKLDENCFLIAKAFSRKGFIFSEETEEVIKIYDVD